MTDNSPATAPPCSTSRHSKPRITTRQPPSTNKTGERERGKATEGQPLVKRFPGSESGDLDPPLTVCGQRLNTWWMPVDTLNPWSRVVSVHHPSGCSGYGPGRAAEKLATSAFSSTSADVTMLRLSISIRASPSRPDSCSSCLNRSTLKWRKRAH